MVAATSRLQFYDSGADVVKPYEIRRNGTALKFHDGTAARQLALHDTTPDFAAIDLGGTEIVNSSGYAIFPRIALGIETAPLTTLHHTQSGGAERFTFQDDAGNGTLEFYMDDGGAPAVAIEFDFNNMFLNFPGVEAIFSLDVTASAALKAQGTTEGFGKLDTLAAGHATVSSAVSNGGTVSGHFPLELGAGLFDIAQFRLTPNVTVGSIAVEFWITDAMSGDSYYKAMTASIDPATPWVDFKFDLVDDDETGEIHYRITNYTPTVSASFSLGFMADASRAA